MKEELQQQAGVFKRNANELKNKMWWKNMKVYGDVELYDLMSDSMYDRVCMIRLLTIRYLTV